MFSLPKRVALSAALASLLALVAASGAGATVAPPVQDGPALTVKADDADDVITLSAVAGGVIVVNGTPTNLAANTNAEISIDAGGGNDVVDVTGLGNGYGKMTLFGGAGDDFITGGARDDILGGGSGDDRLLGFRGSDIVLGQEGNDLMIWNPADGSDHNDGDAGIDEVEVNGSASAGDEFDLRVDADRFVFHRDSGVEFDIDFTAERLTVNGLGGNDEFRPQDQSLAGLGALGITLNGGGGSDTLIGANGIDRINGGGAPDALLGGGGRRPDQRRRRSRFALGRRRR